MEVPMVLGTASWNADALEATSIAYRASSRIAGAVDNRLALLALAGKLWKLDSHLKNLLESFYREVERNEKRQNATEDQVRAGIGTLRNLATQLEALYIQGRSARLTNRTLVGTVLNSVRVRADELFDIAESVELAMNPSSGIDEVFQRSLDEYQRGESLELSNIN